METTAAFDGVQNLHLTEICHLRIRCASHCAQLSYSL